MNSGALTQDDIDDLLKMMYQNARDDPFHMQISQETLWMLEYAWQGRRYPRKRKSKMRMSKKWRKG
jgi:hypothetical protein